MTSKRRSQLAQLKTCDFSDEEDPGDYLQDPDLLTDKLPQPFRMLDNLLKDTLYKSWEMIETREVEREREAARVKIPEVSDWKRVSFAGDHELGGISHMECGKEGCVFVGGRCGFQVLKEVDGDLELIAESREIETDLNCLDVVWSKDVHFIAAICNKEMKIFALIKDILTCICSISPQIEDQCYVTGHFSPTISHIGLAVSHTESGMQLEFHKLPLESWRSQLSQFLEKLEAVKTAAEEQGQDNQVNVQEEMVYSKPVLLCLFHPPKGVAPCPINDPAAAFQRVKEGCREHLPTGDLHILTQKYFDNRKKAFLSQYPHLAQDYDSIIDFNYSHSYPTFHFIYYKNSCRQVQPCFVVIWWENHNQIFVYPLPTEPGKNPSTAVQLYWLLPHASPVVSSALSSDSKLLAVGQGTGVVTVWNFQTYFCESVFAVAPDPDSITCLEFFNNDSMIGVGTEQGNVMTFCTGADRNKPPFSLNQRIKKQMEAYGDLFKSSGYDRNSRILGLQVNQLLPSVLSSVHADGGVILWSSTDREALCKLSLPHSLVPQQCSYTSDGKRLLMVRGADAGEDGTSGLISVDMTSAGVSSLISKHWRKESDKDSKVEDEIITGGFMEVIERQLQDYIKYRHTQHEADSIRWNKRWAELNSQIK